MTTKLDHQLTLTVEHLDSLAAAAITTACDARLLRVMLAARDRANAEGKVVVLPVFFLLAVKPNDREGDHAGD